MSITIQDEPFYPFRQSCCDH